MEYMEKVYRNGIGLIGFIFLIISIYTFSISFSAFIATFSFSIISFSILDYNFPSWRQFLFIFIAWVLGIYSISNFFINYSQISINIFEFGPWSAFYPSMIILYTLMKKVDDIKWTTTSIASMDTFVIFGIIFLLISGISGINNVSLPVGLTHDWREYYLYSVSMLLYVTSIREKYEIKALPRWNKHLKDVSGLFAFLSGVAMTLLSLFAFIQLKNIDYITFILQGAVGILVCFFVLDISKKDHSNNIKKIQ